MRFENLHSTVNLSTQGKDDFEILAYTGVPVDRYFGKLAIALTGIQFKQRIPILQGHDRNLIVGYSTRCEVTDQGLMITGTFSKSTDAGRQAAALVSEGFPWQASIGVQPLKITDIGANESSKCNGHNVPGPGEIWDVSTVFETSFVPLGADDNTKISKLALSGVNRSPWPSDAVREEFGGNLEVYQSYLDATKRGLASVCNRNVCG